MERKNFGSGLSMDAKLTFFFFVVTFAGSACKNSDNIENKNSNFADLGYPKSELSEFWSGPLLPGSDCRALALHESGGLYVVWERINNGMPMTQLHTAYSSYHEDDGKVYLENPFCGDFVLKRDHVDGVEVLRPVTMSVIEAENSNWLLIRREGASFDSPFSSNNFTKFDRAGPSREKK